MNRSLLVALIGLGAALAAGTAAAQALGGPSGRGQNWEFYGGLRSQFSEDIGFQGGSQVEVDDDLGFAFGGGYNFDEHLNVSGELAWGNPDYDGTLVSAEDPPEQSVRLAGELDVLALSATATWHFLEGPLTPYVSGTLGYTWIDTNIATGPPETFCWWDPWWGYVCDTFVDTKDEESFTYGLGVGVRWDFDRGWFGRLSYEERWLDVGNANGTPSFGTVHLDVGSKF